MKTSIHEVDSPIRYCFQFQNYKQSISAVYRLPGLWRFIIMAQAVLVLYE